MDRCLPCPMLRGWCLGVVFEVSQWPDFKSGREPWFPWADPFPSDTDLTGPDSVGIVGDSPACAFDAQPYP